MTTPPRRRRHLPSVIPQALALAVTLAACEPPAPSGPDDDDDTTEPEPTPDPRGWEGVFALISFRCGCHDVEQREGGMWDLTDEQSAWDALVGTPSNDVPEVARIEPFLPDRSYMLLKIENRQAEVGGEGTRMPPTGFALPDDRIELIREWIEDGALP